MIHLYIDTNAYLTFYHMSSDDLEELKKLDVLIKDKRIKLYLPQQTIDEFRRNREVKIADALKRFKEEKLTNQFL
ncbi:PIN domain-containing protein, partial [Chitinophaga terrae (ex Kim and Jung 2007)]